MACLPANSALQWITRRASFVWVAFVLPCLLCESTSTKSSAGVWRSAHRPTLWWLALLLVSLGMKLMASFTASLWTRRTTSSRMLDFSAGRIQTLSQCQPRLAMGMMVIAVAAVLAVSLPGLTQFMALMAITVRSGMSGISRDAGLPRNREILLLLLMKTKSESRQPRLLARARAKVRARAVAKARARATKRRL